MNTTRYITSVSFFLLLFWVGIDDIPIGVQKPGPQYSPAIYTMDIAYKIDIPLYMFDRIYYNI